jgi:hypothetical protein
VERREIMELREQTDKKKRFSKQPTLQQKTVYKTLQKNGEENEYMENS